jgi:16S rRNA (guanine(527)-N(7))-methyltransferase RsmG
MMGHTVDSVYQEVDRLGCQLERPVVERLAQYVDLLVRWNAKLRLVGSHDPRVLVQRHMADALMLHRLLADRNGRLVDVGSGGGWPAIPLGVLCPSLLLTLVEARQRKAAFLQSASHELGVTATVRAERVENLVGQLEPFDFACSLATFAPQQWLSKGRELVRSKGSIFVFVVSEGDLPAQQPGVCRERAHRYELADGAGRCVLVYRKCE